MTGQSLNYTSPITLLSYMFNCICIANDTNSATLVLRGFAPPPHAAPLSKAQFSLNILYIY
jgi:hypothetical protein